MAPKSRAPVAPVITLEREEIGVLTPFGQGAALRTVDDSLASDEGGSLDGWYKAHNACEGPNHIVLRASCPCVPGMSSYGTLNEFTYDGVVLSRS